MRDSASPLLRVESLRTTFAAGGSEVRAVDGIDLVVHRGETVGLVGESGCGKTVTSLSILRLLPAPPARIVEGSRILWKGEEDLLAAGPERLRAVRGPEIGMVFQEPMSSLNPVMRVGDQIAEAIRAHTQMRGAALERRVVELLERVGIPRPAERRHAWPHQLSGGMRQRVMIAIALACEPSLLIADEPTTALDVTVQAQILALLRELQSELGMAILLITHDLGVVSALADRVLVMYAGRIVEEGPLPDLFRAPRHPYTEGLIAALPDPDRARGIPVPIPGAVPHPTEWPAGCRFNPRCRHAWDRCRRREPPPLSPPAGGAGWARCWLLEEPERRMPAEGET